MNIRMTGRVLAGIALLCIGAALAAIVVFAFQNEPSIQLIMGLLLGLAITLAFQYLVRQWIGFTRDPAAHGGAALVDSLADVLSAKLGLFADKETARRVIGTGASAGLVLLSSSTMIAVFSVVFSVALYMATILQVRKLEEQNRLINVQNHLTEASRRSSLIFLFGNILDKVSDELKEKGNTERNLSTELIGRIAALGQAFRPYRFTENGMLVDTPISPERGQLVVALYNSQLSNPTYFAIFNATNLTSADLRNATLHKVNLSEATMDSADFAGANLIEANVQLAKFRKAQFDGAKLNKADVGLADFGDASLRGADFRGVKTFLGAKFRGADLTKAKFGEADWKRLLSEAAEDGSREYISANFELDSKQQSDETGPFRVVIRRAVARPDRAS